MAIISQIEHVKKYTDSRISVNINQLLPTSINIYDKYLKSYIPRELYTELDAVNEASASALQKKLLDSLRGAVANFVLVDYIPIAETQLGATGIFRLDGDKEKPAYKNQIAAAIRGYKTNAYAYLNSLLSIIVANASAIDTWKDSIYAVAYNNQVFKNYSEFDFIITLSSPVLTYHALLPIIRDVERIVMVPTFKVVYTGLKTKNTLSPVEAELLHLFKCIVANATMVRAIPKLGLRIEQGGITALSTDSAYVETKNEHSMRDAQLLAESYASSVNEYMQLAVNYLNDHTADFPTWKKYNTPTQQKFNGLLCL